MGQIIVSILLGAVMWMAFRSFRAFNEDHKTRVKARQQAEARRAGQGRKDPIEDMRECPVCNTFRPASRTTSCGRAQCPYGR